MERQDKAMDCWKRNVTMHRFAMCRIDFLGPWESCAVCQISFVCYINDCQSK